jgi:hypothetical protein
MNAPSISTKPANPFDAWFMPVPQLNGISLMDHLYNRLDGAYPHKWRSNFPSPEAIDNWKVSWAEAFEEEGITPADVRAGLKACRTRYDWPPSCAEFIKACKPSIDPLVAYYQAVNGMQAREKGEMGEWGHPAVFWAAVQISAFDLKNQSYSQIKTRWESALQEQMGKGAWDAVPVPLPALPAPGKSKMSREHATKMMQELQATETVKKSDDRVDHKAWAKKILERSKLDRHGLSALQIRMAKDALNASEAA